MRLALARLWTQAPRGRRARWSQVQGNNADDLTTRPTSGRMKARTVAASDCGGEPKTQPSDARMELAVMAKKAQATSLNNLGSLMESVKASKAPAKVAPPIPVPAPTPAPPVSQVPAPGGAQAADFAARLLQLAMERSPDCGALSPVVMDSNERGILLFIPWSEPVATSSGDGVWVTDGRRSRACIDPEGRFLPTVNVKAIVTLGSTRRPQKAG